jgi:hypothetical protein
MIKPPKNRRFQIGNHHNAITTYHQHDDQNRDWGIKISRYVATWWLDLYTGQTIRVLHIRLDRNV